MERIIKVIKSEQEYEMALETLEGLMGATPETREFDKLEVLAMLIKKYEDEHYPIAFPSPSEAIKFYMDQRGLKPKDLAPYLGGKNRVSEVLAGKRQLTIKMIRALRDHLGISADVLVGEDGELPEEIAGMDWEKFPLKEMAKRGLFPDASDLMSRAEENMRSLLARAGDSVLFGEAACFRQGRRRNAKDDPYAIQAWLLEVKLRANEIEVEAKYDPEFLGEDMLAKVVRLSAYQNGPLLVRQYLSRLGIRLVFVPHYKGTYLDGAVLLLDDGSPVIAMTLRYDRLDNFWFTLLHELAHLVRGHVSEASRCILDDLDLNAKGTGKEEEEADQLALDTEIPPQEWERHPAKSTGRLQDVLNLARRLDISPAIIAGRVRFEKKNWKILSRHVGQGKVRDLIEHQPA